MFYRGPHGRIVLKLNVSYLLKIMYKKKQNQKKKTVRPRRLKLVTHVNNGWMYRVYQNQTAAAYSFLYFFIFLSLQFSNIKIFVALLSGTVHMSPRKMKLGTHMNNGWMYCVYRNQAAAAYSSFFSFFFLSNFQTLKFFITLFSGT